jgi:RimJ/RimL family protein N-acetyltransferase
VGVAPPEAAQLSSAGGRGRRRAYPAVVLVVRRPRAPLTDGVVALRPWALEDVRALTAALDGDEEISRWLELIPQPYGPRDARAWVELTAAAWKEATMGAFAVTEAGAARLLGGAGLRVEDAEHAVAEVGYGAARAARGRGVTTRATRLVARWALQELGAERVQLRAERENVGSQRVAEKAGFVREGVLRSCRYNPRLARRMDFVMYSLLPGEAAWD